MKDLLWVGAVGTICLASACGGKSSGTPQWWVTPTGSSGGSTSGEHAGATSSSGAAGPFNSGSYDAGLTYADDVQPILARSCATCHIVGGIAPFPLLTYEDAYQNRASIATAVAAKTMPPWFPDDTCNSYQLDRSLSDTEIATIVDWAAGEAAQGDPSLPPVPPSNPPGISRVDLSLPMPMSFTPTIYPDDYECFMIDYPETTEKYITGFQIVPGNPKLVHHAIAFVIPPDQLASYNVQEESLPDGGKIPTYPCFGGPGGTLGYLTGWLGSWSPGFEYGDLPAGTGIPIQPGSEIILQVHYNLANGPGESDQSTVQLELADSVEKPGAMIGFTNPLWAEVGNMVIPANDSNVNYGFQLDPTLEMAILSNGILPEFTALKLYSAGVDMHLRATHGQLDIIRSDGGTDCLIDVPAYNFKWQGNYFLQQPMDVFPGDQVSLECWWDNSAANQPIIDGGQVPSTTLDWGENSTQEMCLGLFYATTQ